MPFFLKIYFYRRLAETTDPKFIHFLKVSFSANLSLDYVTDRLKYGLGGGLAERVATFLRSQLEHAKLRHYPVFSKGKDENGNLKERNEVKMEVDSEDEEIGEVVRFWV